MNKISNKLLILLVSSLFSSVALAANNSVVYVGKIKLVFEKEITCELSDPDGKNSVKGRSNIVHDEDSISWTSTCLIQLPKNVSYCSMSSQEVSNSDAFTYWYSGFQKKVLRAKIVSESDINPAFGSYSASFICFE